MLIQLKNRTEIPFWKCFKSIKNIPNQKSLGKFSQTSPAHQPWPYFPNILKATTSHKEGVERHWNISTKSFNTDKDGNLESLTTINVEWKKDDNGRFGFVEVPGSEKVWPCQLVLLALGFVGPETDTVVAQYNLNLDARGNILAQEKSYQTSKENVFAAGDARRGQSLIVWAISEGREAAHYIDKYLMGSSNLPLKGGLDIPRV
ncbi:MAG: hypothetical protein C4K58_05585 [Flavobacteriaceae bacterium]|nr:MAG: hypothetical protein C4K58_05585 [Flavobacteriaceae bacterium]